MIMKSKGLSENEIRKYRLWGNFATGFASVALLSVYLLWDFRLIDPRCLPTVRIAVFCTFCGFLAVWGLVACTYSRLLQRIKEELEERDKSKAERSQ